MGKAARKLKVVPKTELKLDLGSGPNKKEGFLGVDAIDFLGVDIVCDLTQPWPWEDGTVVEVNSGHFIEHLTAMQRVHFANELWRVMKVGATAQIIVPHWAGCRAYGDPTHQWPPVSEFWFFYLSREWRNTQAPHTDAQHLPGGFNCNFAATWGYGMHPSLGVRSQEYQQFAVANYKEAVTDMWATLTRME